jgi:hypothetical protein
MRFNDPNPVPLLKDADEPVPMLKLFQLITPTPPGAWVTFTPTEAGAEETVPAPLTKEPPWGTWAWAGTTPKITNNAAVSGLRTHEGPVAPAFFVCPMILFVKMFPVNCNREIYISK